MKINKILSILLVAITFLTLSSCRSTDDEKDTQDTTPGNVQVKFSGFSGIGDIVLNQTVQTSANGQKHRFSTLKYIVSNIVLIDENGNN